MNARQPDRAELGIRFGCGTVFGIVVGLAVAMHTVRPGWRAIIVIGVVAPVCGLLAARLGDAFWRFVLDSWPWLI
jgi:hypothetical protein